MPYPATVFQVMIASPGDVAEEREKARELIHQWNANHSREKGIVLLPADWTTHSSPEMGDRPQEIINKQVLEDSDLLVGIFWTRLGTPTGEAQSGTVEEIEKHVAAGKPAMLYFSSKPCMPDGIDQDQYSRLKEFKKEQEQKGLCCGFDSIQDFESQFRNHLYQKITNHYYFKENSSPFGPFGEIGKLAFDEPEATLSAEAIQLLKAASLSKRSGPIQNLSFLGGKRISVDGNAFLNGNDPREKATWDSALEALEINGLIKDDGYKREIFSLTKKGFDYVDKLTIKS